ncbi:MAG: hypothetical protein H0U59_06145 [Gemmatimonadaceae bacterium]|nr:hypothetical protein [Gemmatimonadaceae bacterium]
MRKRYWVRWHPGTTGTVTGAWHVWDSQRERTVMAYWVNDSATVVAMERERMAAARDAARRNAEERHEYSSGSTERASVRR